MQLIGLENTIIKNDNKTEKNEMIQGRTYW